MRALVSQPSCTDPAITALEGFAQGDPLAKSDLAGAYYVRAQREDRATDLLHAVETATEATAAAPNLPAAHFNRALALEAIGLAEDALAEWNEAARLDSLQWAAEARTHYDRLMQQRKGSASVQWPVAVQQLEAALQVQDAQGIAESIAPFPTRAMKYFEETVLPRTAAAPSAQNLAAARMLATALSKRLQGDQFPIAAVDAIAHPKDARALREGHEQFAKAVALSGAFSATRRDYATAADLLERGGSPLAVRANYGIAAVLSNAPDRTAALRILDSVEATARERHYWHLLARTLSLRAHCLGYQNKYLDSISSYDAALTAYERIRDQEGIIGTIDRRFSVFDTAGQHDLAWRSAIKLLRDESLLSDVQSRHLLLGDTGKVATALQYPQVALLYRNAAIRLIENALGENASNPNLRVQLAVALRNRAEVEVQLEQFERANADLRKSKQLDPAAESASVRAILESRMQEISGRAFLATRPQLAIAAFTSALAVSEGDNFRTARARLFAQRAEAHRRAGNRENAEADLRAALAELHAEEAGILKKRRRGAGEELWSSYFSRFQETYRFLIRLLMDAHRTAEAFGYAERARAFEPLDLILKLELTPRRFREMAGRGAEVQAIQKYLPDDTFLIEYTLLEDRTYAWIVSHHDGVALTLPTKRKDVDRWSESISKAVRTLNERAFEDGLIAPYDGLLAAPLSKISKLRNGQPSHIVIVPDGAMHALPFAALRNPDTERYVIQDHEVTIAPSALLYVFSRMRDAEQPADRSALLVADPLNGEPLPHARSEVDTIRLFYPQHEMLIGKEATVPQFLTRARDHAIVHVAAHALVDPSLPSQSRILLAGSAQDDGALDAEEMLTDLRLEHTRLMVLSTCSSAGGAPVGPEGVAPLVRPILTAGVPAVIGTLWDVHDPTAERFFVSFHQHYREGRSAAEALRAAQLDLLGARGYKPMAWAPFQVIGYASSPFAPPHDTKKEKPP